MMILPAFPARGQAVSDTTSTSVNVFFHQGWSRIDPAYRGNEQNLLSFIAAVDSLSADSTVVRNVIHIRSSASPEGKRQENLLLSQRRTKSTLDFIQSRTHTKDICYETESVGEDWEGLARLLDTATFEGAKKAAEIIRTTPYYIVRNGQIVGGRKKMLMDMQGGRVWWKMNDLLFPELRSSSVCVWYTRVLTLPPELPDSLSVAADTASLTESEPEPMREESEQTGQDAQVEQLAEPVASGDISTEDANIALRTNLLFDAATLVNCGVELPVGRNWSIEADVYFPWWKIPSKDITVQLVGATLEGKYWFGDRSARPVMTGFFAGVYAGAGYYDFQFGDGMQGELFIMGGLSVGYSHKLNDVLRLEYSAGLGYVRSEYREYTAVHDTKYGNIKVRPYPWEEKRFSGIVPSKASVSLVWMLDTKKGGRR